MAAHGKISRAVVSRVPVPALLALLVLAAALTASPSAHARLLDGQIALNGEISSYDEKQVLFLIQKQILVIPRQFVSKSVLDSAQGVTRIELTAEQLEQCRFLPGAPTH